MNTQQVFTSLWLMQSLLNWLETRGITRARSLELLERADAENRDLTTAEVQAELDTTAAELDETQRLLGS